MIQVIKILYLQFRGSFFYYLGNYNILLEEEKGGLHSLMFWNESLHIN